MRVNSCWMCDYGRLNYKWIGREDRLWKSEVRNPKPKTNRLPELGVTVVWRRFPRN